MNTILWDRRTGSSQVKGEVAMVAIQNRQWKKI